VAALSTEAGISRDELQLAARNHAMPLEALRWPITPVGLHYLLIHYDVPLVEAASWRLEVGGSVERAQSLSLDDLRALPPQELVATMECAGNGRALLEPRPISQPWLDGAVGTARWRGAALEDVLERAGVQERAVELVFAGLDRGVEGDVEQRYERSLSLPDAAGAVLAYEMNGAPLPPQHGFPVRLVVPGWYGMTNVKWLAAITAVDEPFTGYQQDRSYRMRQEEDDEGRAVTRMQPRALLLPPGIPDFATRHRLLRHEEHELTGRAWSGRAPVERVEVSTDGGTSWADAEVTDELGSPWAWRGWRYRWTPPAAGDYVLCCRAHDGAGGMQPADPPWNLGGYENNAVQRVAVTVTH
jgi:DMSO/TMAO reductase YedYZ molybdopterin-dependent catalytic subunit